MSIHLKIRWINTIIVKFWEKYVLCRHTYHAQNDQRTTNDGQCVRNLYMGEWREMTKRLIVLPCPWRCSAECRRRWSQWRGWRKQLTVAKDGVPYNLNVTNDNHNMIICSIYLVSRRKPRSPSAARTIRVMKSGRGIAPGSVITWSSVS